MQIFPHRDVDVGVCLNELFFLGGGGGGGVRILTLIKNLSLVLRL